MAQIVLKASKGYSQLDAYLEKINTKSIFLVCGKSFRLLNIAKYFEDITERLGIDVIQFSDFQPNPLYESVEKAVKLYKDSKCDSIVAVGGGSALDVAKCVKLYSNMDDSKNYLNQNIIENDIAILAIPTTAGTGSEATKFSVIYYEGEKQSVSHDSCIPNAVYFDASTLKTLPEYQKKSTMLDALCHSIESFWSVNSTEESKRYSSEAIRLILSNYEKYLENEISASEQMFLAANYAGKAINITQTTAGHAMCYKLTSLYGISHGHAAALCVSKLWPFMVNNISKCVDVRGKLYLEQVFINLAKIMKCETSIEAVNKFESLLTTLCIDKPKIINSNDFEILKNSVNPIRLKNNPVKLIMEDIDCLYHQILEK